MEEAAKKEKERESDRESCANGNDGMFLSLPSSLTQSNSVRARVSGRPEEFTCSLYISRAAGPQDHAHRNQAAQLSRSNLEEAIRSSEPLASWHVSETSCGLIAAFAREADAEKLLQRGDLARVFGGPVQVARFSARDSRYRQAVLLRDVPWAIPLQDLSSALAKQGISTGSVERSRQFVRVEVHPRLTPRVLSSPTFPTTETRRKITRFWTRATTSSYFVRAWTSSELRGSARHRNVGGGVEMADPINPSQETEMACQKRRISNRATGSCSAIVVRAFGTSLPTAGTYPGASVAENPTALNFALGPGTIPSVAIAPDHITPDTVNVL